MFDSNHGLEVQHHYHEVVFTHHYLKEDFANLRLRGKCILFTVVLIILAPIILELQRLKAKKEVKGNYN